MPFYPSWRWCDVWQFPHFRVTQLCALWYRIWERFNEKCVVNATVKGEEFTEGDIHNYSWDWTIIYLVLRSY